MPGPRISIAGLMALIALLGVTFSALHAVTEFSSSAMLTLALVASAVVLLCRLSTRGTARATWTGYLIFGTGYLAMCAGPWCDEHLMPNLVTTQFIDEQYSKMEFTPIHGGERVWTSLGTRHEYAAGEVFGKVNAQTANFDVYHDRGTRGRYTASQLRSISPSSYRRLWHSALSVWLGLPGIALARYLFGSRQDKSISGRGIASAPSA
jgi:uncharacterized membrane protein